MTHFTSRVSTFAGGSQGQQLAIERLLDFCNVAVLRCVRKMDNTHKIYRMSPVASPATREEPLSERAILDRAIASLRQNLPPGWRLRETREPAGSRRLDALLEVITPSGTSARIAVEAKRLLSTREASYALEQLRERIAEEGLDAVPMLVARYLPPRTRERIAQSGAAYADATGNAEIILDRPAVLIKLAGQDRDPWRGPGRPKGSLKGAPAARVVRALVDHAPPYTVPALCGLAGASTGATYRVVKLLEEEELLERVSRGPIQAVAWRRLLERWSKDYGFVRADRVERLLAPRGLPQLAEAISRLHDNQPVITGSFAAHAIAPAAPSRLFWAYVRDVDAAVDALGLRKVDAGANVMLARNEDDFGSERPRQVEGLHHAALSQVAVDLLTGPGRLPSEAEALLAWMEDHEHRWRR